jgi:hypothetical protein
MQRTTETDPHLAGFKKLLWKLYMLQELPHHYSFLYVELMIIYIGILKGGTNIFQLPFNLYMLAYSFLIQLIFMPE